MEGWVKLHRKVLRNQFLMHDPTARDIFFMLLLLVDRHTGEWSGGSKQLAKSLGYATHTTTYRALKRLETQRIVQRIVQRRYTTIRICKWDEYQGDAQRPTQRIVQNARNADATQVSTIPIKQEGEGRREKNDSSLSLLDLPNYKRLFKKEDDASTN